MLIYIVLINGIIKEKKLFKKEEEGASNGLLLLTADMRHIESACNGTD